jgi:hypothetical protein
MRRDLCSASTHTATPQNKAYCHPNNNDVDDHELVGWRVIELMITGLLGMQAIELGE